MGLGERCDEIVQLIEKTLAEVGADHRPARATAVAPTVAPTVSPAVAPAMRRGALRRGAMWVRPGTAVGVPTAGGGPPAANSTGDTTTDRSREPAGDAVADRA